MLLPEAQVECEMLHVHVWLPVAEEVEEPPTQAVHEVVVPGYAPLPIVEKESTGQLEQELDVPEPLVEYEPAGHAVQDPCPDVA